ncbi:MAG TPA: WYL domain-containing transcriptional regulator [Candidatus Limnocylindrales bacterium]|nr:WYL domain-containing transcriptional regulator [Candidatus Limnocylindrales bacterium]
MVDGMERGGGKRDRAARLMRVAALLVAHPDGMHPKDIAERLGMSVRNVYRDLHALEDEVQVPTWSDEGRWGVLPSAFLPPLKLTLSEAMAVFLATRLMVRYADKYDPDLGSAFEKLQDGLPATLREHIARSLDVLQRAPIDPEFIERVRLLTRAWADRRVVEIEYEGAAYEGRPGDVSRRTVHPWLIEPSLRTHALYLIGYDVDRRGMRTFKIERIRSVRLTPGSFDYPEPSGLETELRRGWDIIADQPPVEVRLRFSPAVADRVLETRWHPMQQTERQADGSLLWWTTVSGTIEIRLWILEWADDVEVLAPEDLRADVAARLLRAAAKYGAAGPGSGG